MKIEHQKKKILEIALLEAIKHKYFKNINIKAVYKQHSPTDKSAELILSAMILSCCRVSKFLITWTPSYWFRKHCYSAAWLYLVSGLGQISTLQHLACVPVMVQKGLQG